MAAVEAAMEKLAAALCGEDKEQTNQAKAHRSVRRARASEGGGNAGEEEREREGVGCRGVRGVGKKHE